MKRKKSIWMAASVNVCFLLLTLTACKKTIAPTSIAAKQSRLDWNLKTTVGAYQEFGNTDPKWDEPATNALAEFAALRSQSVVPDEDSTTIIRTNCDAAVQAGCDDPMVCYLYIKYAMSPTNSPKSFTDAFGKTEADIEHSRYPSIRKFYAALRAQQQLYYAYPTNFDKQLTSELARHIYDNLVATVADKTTPPEEVYEACHEGLYQMSGSKDWYERCYNELEKSLFANWPKESVSFLLKGEAYLQMAWSARGSGYAKDVTLEGWKSFGEHLSVAETSLKKAWQLNPKDPRTPTIMIRVDEAQQKNRDDMELWFNRAMNHNPNNYEACENKLHYLYPQWYGSRDEMIAFGKECAISTNWGGNVPLILSDAHREYWLYLDDAGEKSNYWKQPDVWPDIKTSFDRFFELNPDAIGYYHNYAWYAYHAEQWDALNKIIPKLGPVNYAYFGGADEFDKMVQLAKKHASNPK